MIKPVKVFKRMFPICFYGENQLLCYKFGIIYKLSLNNFKIIKLMQLPFSLKHNILSRRKLLCRFFRFGVRYGINISQNEFIIVRDNVLYEIDIEKQTITSGYKLKRGSHPLNIVTIDLDGFEKTLYFGEYFHNPEKESIYIYKRKTNDVWEEVYHFNSGEINHIHNLIPDTANKCVWILTGDFGDSSAIWQAKNNFKEVKIVCRGEQKFRSCVAYPYNGGLVYVTDTPFQNNSVFFLTQVDNNWKAILISEINGSVIYSTNMKNNFIFSTVVENNGGEPLLKKIFAKRGDGIKKNICVIYLMDDKLNISEILSNKKDFLSFYLFQFGSIRFPSGKNMSEYLPVYNTGTKKYDQSLVLYKVV